MATTIQQVRQDRDAADPVDQCVMQFHDHCPTFPIDALDNDGLPRRKLDVEAGGGHHLGDIEHVTKRTLLWQDDSPEMEVKVETAVLYELRPASTGGSRHSVRSEPRHGLGKRRDPGLDI